MDKNKADIASRVEQDHADIRAEIDKIKGLMIEELNPSDFSNWRLDFIWQLRDFKNHLLQHFDLEEEGGFMRDVIKVSPHSEGKVNHLKDEHSKMVTDLDGILLLLKDMHDQDTSSLKQINEQIGSLMSDLHSHEEEEHILMQRAYYREYGGPA
jgi:hypothetical protein